ncbi:MAG: hypothetical protein LUF87_00730 [Alistipes sp.]|nr:hypothetical protein [Alistipes sp.]
MKKLFAIIILTALAVRASGQNPDAVITYGAELDHSGGYSFVSFGVSVGKRAIPNTHTLILSPVITDGVNEETLPPVIIQGGKRGSAGRDTKQLDNGDAVPAACVQRQGAQSG